MKMECENGEISDEPLKIIDVDDTVSCAQYTLENNMLDTPGWKRFKPITKKRRK